MKAMKNIQSMFGLREDQIMWRRGNLNTQEIMKINQVFKLKNCAKSSNKRSNLIRIIPSDNDVINI